MSTWIEVLQAACKASSQSAVAKRLGYSTTVVNQVLKGSYTGDLQRVQLAVEGALMGATVDCPILGDIPRLACVDHQRHAQGAFVATNPTRVQLRRACPTCPNRTGG